MSMSIGVMHSIFNSLSAFANRAVISEQRSIISALFIIIVSGGYALYIATILVSDYGRNTERVLYLV